MVKGTNSERFQRQDLHRPPTIRSGRYRVTVYEDGVFADLIQDTFSANGEGNETFREKQELEYGDRERHTV